MNFPLGISRFFSIPEHILPEIKSSATIFGYINNGILRGIPIGAVRTKNWALLYFLILSFLGTRWSTGSTCWSTMLVKRNSKEHVCWYSSFSNCILLKYLYFRYGTGCFILYNTGEDLAYSKNGLLTTVAYKWNDNKAVYALEVRI